jgi:hypothetical protein
MNLKEFIFDGPLYKINITKTKKGVGDISFKKFFKKQKKTPLFNGEVHIKLFGFLQNKILATFIA